MSGAIGNLREIISQSQSVLDLFGQSEEILAALSDMSSALQDAAGAVMKIASGTGAFLNNAQITVSRDMVTAGFGQIADSLNELRHAADAVGNAGGHLRDALRDVENMSEQAQRAADHISDAVGTVTDALSDASDSAGELFKMFNDLTSKAPLQFTQFGDDYRHAGDNLHAAVSGIFEQLGFLNGDITTTANSITNDLRAINTQLNIVLQLLADAVAGITNTSGDLWEDTSEEDLSATTMGKAIGCLNHGGVAADVNAGGIAGSMAIEYDLDPEDDISKEGQNSFNFIFETKAIIQDCVNRGEITAKKDSAGGIVGRMDLGLVIGSEGYGKVTSTNGNYVGGIAGYSSSAIRSCYAKCVLSGGRYIGGISGYATKLQNCYTLIKILEGNEYVGAIAGSRDLDGSVNGNYFVHDTLAGIDGISYSGVAEPVDYQMFISREEMPEEFTFFTLTFIADSDVVRMVRFQYGDDGSDLILPDIPEKTGYYSEWPEHDYNCMTFSAEIEAVYIPYITTIASSAMRDDIHAMLLVEGYFDEDAIISAKISDAETISLKEDQNVLEQWTFMLTGVDTDTGGNTVRYFPPETEGAIMLFMLENGTWRKIDHLQDGSYLVFPMESNEMTLCAVETTRQLDYVFYAIGAVLIIVFALLIISRFRKRRRERKTNVMICTQTEPDAKEHSGTPLESELEEQK